MVSRYLSLTNRTLPSLVKQRHCDSPSGGGSSAECWTAAISSAGTNLVTDSPTISASEYPRNLSAGGFTTATVNVVMSIRIVGTGLILTSSAIASGISL